MCRYLIILTLLFSCLSTIQAQQTYAFINTHIIPMHYEGIVENQTVIVTDGKISALGDSKELPIPSNATVIESEDFYLMPGLAEMHGHIPGPDNQQYLEDILFLYVANGVTTVRGMLGQPAHLELREKISTQEILGPRLFTPGISLRRGRVDSAEHARQIVMDQADAGYDFIKIHPGITRPQYDAAMQAAVESGMTLSGHVPEDVGLAHALSKGQVAIDHMDGYAQYLVSPEIDISDYSAGYYGMGFLEIIDTSRILQAARETRNANAWVVPTQILFEQRISEVPAQDLAKREDMAYMPSSMVQRWVQAKEQIVSTISTPDGPARLLEIRQQLIKALNDEGARLLLGSDAPQVFNVPGFSIHHEIRSMMDAGLTAYEVLRTGTVAPAEFFEKESEFGRISVGLAADLILVENNPLSDVTTVSRPLGVMIRGRWLDRAALDEGLMEIAERQR